MEYFIPAIAVESFNKTHFSYEEDKFLYRIERREREREREE